MDVSITYDAIMAVVEEEVSREAAQARTAEGLSLYDELRMTSRDEAKKKRLVEEAVVVAREMLNRFADSIDDTEDGVAIALGLSSRRENGREASINAMLRSIMASIVLNRYFLSKGRNDLAEKYNSLASADIQALNRILYTKLPPSYPA